MAPANMAPGLFALARRKNLSIKDALNGNHWMRGLQRMNNELLIDQFIQLWELIQPLILSNEPDAITWRLTNDGAYSAKSAYEAQFIGHIVAPLLHATWKVKAEPKVRFYLWLLLQNRNWTADQVVKISA